MRMLVILALFALISACTDAQNFSDAKSNKQFASKAEADAASPLGLSCERTEQVPISRGRGQGLEGKFETVTYYYPGFLRGDVNNDGQITRDDAMLAVKKLFKVENVVCPRTADVAGYPQTLVPDGFFTSQDIYIFNTYKNTGVISWPQDVICGYDCAVPNHMDPNTL